MTDGDLNAALLIYYLNFDFTHILQNIWKVVS